MLVRPARGRGRRASPTTSATLALSAVALALTGCAAPPADGIAPPPPGARFDYQLGGTSPVPDGVGIVVRDSTDEPAPGAYGICYVNAFQTQPGSSWPDGLLVAGADGRPLTDPGWPDEHVLDISTPALRERIAARQSRVVDACADAGYQGVELDNLDSWTRSGGALDADDALAYAALLVGHAHGLGLAVAQKNAADLGTRGRDEAGFDFAIVEECDRWDECGSYADVFGRRVLDVEYVDDLRDTAAGACARLGSRDPELPAVIRDRGLVPAGGPGYAFRAC